MDIRGLIYDSCYDDAMEKMYEAMPESIQQFMKQHDDIMLFLALRDVFHLLDLMELGDREKLEFHKLTKTGQIQIEAAEKTYGRIRQHLLYQMKKLADEVTVTEASVLVTVVFKILDSAVYTGCKITSITN